MDRYSRSIILSLFVVLILTVLAVGLSLYIPFDVNQSGTVQNISGAIELRSSNKELPATLDTRQDSFMLRVGQTIHAAPNSAATITFFNQGRATLTGPAALTLVESYRRATLPGHTIDSARFERDYVLTLAQSSGSIRYLFANTDPSFENVQITIRLPNGNYVPTSPCWQIDISADGTVATGALACPT